MNGKEVWSVQGNDWAARDIIRGLEISTRAAKEPCIADTQTIIREFDVESTKEKPVLRTRRPTQ